MASGTYAEGIKSLLLGDIPWVSATVKCQLTTNAYTPNFDTDNFRDDITAYKMSGTTDQSIGSKAVNIDTANNRVHLDGPATVTFSAVTGGSTVTGVALYEDNSAAASDNLICWNEFSAGLATNGSDIQVTFATDGHVRFTYTS
jgi:hypothetical protein